MDEAGEYEVAIHWLPPGSHFNESATTEDGHVHCLYAFNTKAVSSSSSKTGIYAGTTSTPQNTLMEVHKQLQELLELVETEKTPSAPGMLLFMSFLAILLTFRCLYNLWDLYGFAKSSKSHLTTSRIVFDLLLYFHLLT